MTTTHTRRGSLLRRALVLTLAAAAAACGSVGQEAATSVRLEATTSSIAESTSLPFDSTQAGSLVATDWSGVEISLDAPATRVVCLDGTCIDALAELGVPPVSSVQIDQVRHPFFHGEDAATVALGGSFMEPDLEGIVAAEPDLVVGSAGVHGALRDALGDIPFFATEIESSADAPEHLRRLATLTGRDDQVEEAIARYETTLAAYGPGEERPVTVLSMYGGATADIGIDALDSSFGQLISSYTAYPWPSAAEGDSGFLEVGVESILEVDPAHIFVLDFAFDPDAPALLDQLAVDPIWQQLQAVDDGHVYAVDNRWWGTTSGTRGQQLYLDAVLPVVYPAEFPAPLGISGG